MTPTESLGASKPATVRKVDQIKMSQFVRPDRARKQGVGFLKEPQSGKRSVCKKHPNRVKVGCIVQRRQEKPEPPLAIIGRNFLDARRGEPRAESIQPNLRMEVVTMHVVAPLAENLVAFCQHA